MKAQGEYLIQKDPLKGRRYNHLYSKKNGGKYRMLILQGADDLQKMDLLISIRDADGQNWNHAVVIDQVFNRIAGQKEDEYFFRIKAIEGMKIEDLPEFTEDDEFVKLASFKILETPIEIQKEEEE